MRMENPLLILVVVVTFSFVMIALGYTIADTISRMDFTATDVAAFMNGMNELR